MLCGGPPAGVAVARGSVHVETLLRHLGIVAEKQGTKWVARCPNPAHDDESPSWAIIDRPGDRKHGSHFCFSCRFRGGPWELAAAVWGTDVEDAGRRLVKLYGEGRGAAAKAAPKVVISLGPKTRAEYALPRSVVVPPYTRWYAPALHYLLHRGVVPAQIQRWGIGYSLRGRLRNRVVIPVRDASGRLLTYTARAIIKAVEGDRYDAGREKDGAAPRRAIWGEELWDRSTPTVTVAEGVFSGLALERAGAPNPCALLGSHLTEEKAFVLGRWPRILVASDPDPAGDRLFREISTMGRRVEVVRVELDLSPDDADPGGLRRAVEEAVSLFP